MRLPQAFGAKAAAAMREVVWRALADVGVRCEKPSTWTVRRPAHLQRWKSDPVFRAVGSHRVLTAIDTILAGQAYEIPRNWGAFFIAFPTKDEWGVPASGWHIDAKYTSGLRPPCGVKTLALFGDVAPRCGGTQIVSGSHRLVHNWFKENPPPPGARSADMRELLQSHPYIRDLHAEGDPDERITRFMGRTEDSSGIPLQVVECTGSAGDVILLHPLTLHAAAPNSGHAPRFMLSGGVTSDMWGWAQS
jgi:ectoine hydroxylase-related dioxygenase (phytanoyl-CoA dioxygenase family)